MSKPVSMSTLKKCGSCYRNDVPLKRCSGCYKISYCSVECQRKAWKAHKTACKALQNTRPSSSVNEEKETGHKYSKKTSSQKTVQPIKEAMKLFSAHPEFIEDNLSFIVQHLYFSATQIPKQYVEHGLQNNQNAAAQLLQRKDLKQLLPHIWAEKDPEYRIAWLRKAVRSFSHPILYLELARALDLIVHKAKEKYSVLGESKALLLLHDLLIIVDLQCFVKKNKTREGFVASLMKLGKTFQNSSLSEEEKQKILPYLQKVLLEELKFLASDAAQLSHPKWLSRLTLSEAQDPEKELVDLRPKRIELLGKTLLLSFMKTEKDMSLSKLTFYKNQMG